MSALLRVRLRLPNGLVDRRRSGAPRVRAMRSAARLRARRRPRGAGARHRSRVRPVRAPLMASQARRVSCEERRVLRRRASRTASRRPCGCGGSHRPAGRGSPGTGARRRTAPIRNQNWLRYQPPGKDSSAGDSTKAVRMSASTAHACRSHRAGRTCAAPLRRVPARRRPRSSSWPNRSRSRAVALSPPSWIAVPEAVAQHLGVVLGAHRRPHELAHQGRSWVPDARSHTQPSASVSDER